LLLLLLLLLLLAAPAALAAAALACGVYQRLSGCQQWRSCGVDEWYSRLPLVCPFRALGAGVLFAKANGN